MHQQSDCMFSSRSLSYSKATDFAISAETVKQDKLVNKNALNKRALTALDSQDI